MCVHVSPYVAVANDPAGDPSAAVLHREVRGPQLSTLPATVEPRQPVRGEDGMPAALGLVRR